MQPTIVRIGEEAAALMTWLCWTKEKQSRSGSYPKASSSGKRTCSKAVVRSQGIVAAVALDSAMENSNNLTKTG